MSCPFTMHHYLVLTFLHTFTWTPPIQVILTWCHFQSHNPWRNTLFSTLDLTLVQPNLINVTHKVHGEDIGDGTQLLKFIGWNCMLWRDMYQWHRLLKADFLYGHLALITCTQSSYEVVRFNVTADDHHRVKMYTLHLLQLHAVTASVARKSLKSL